MQAGLRKAQVSEFRVRGPHETRLTEKIKGKRARKKVRVGVRARASSNSVARRAME